MSKHFDRGFQVKRCLWVVGVFGVVACSSEDRAAETARREIIQGIEDRGDPAVAYMSAQSGGSGWGCTASLISSTVLLTARHCVDGAGSSANVRVFFGTDSDGAGRWEGIDSWISDPDFNGELELGHDVALLFLDDPVTDIIPLPFKQTAFEESQRGANVRIVGFGDNLPGSGSGLKREQTTILHNWDGGVVETGGGGISLCSGDSGGPAFLSVNGREEIIGVASYVEDYSCATHGWSSRTDLSSTWILDQLAAHGGVPNCTAACEGRVCGGDGCGGSCGTCATGDVCNASGQCDVCTASCDGRTCGDDGCGGSCGACAENFSCTTAGQCLEDPPPTNECDENGGWEDEPNNDGAHASGLCSDGHVYGTSSSSTDPDWYFFQATAPFSVRLVAPPGRYTLNVYRNEHGSWVLVGSGSTSSSGSSTEVESSAPGAHRFEVVGAGPSNWGYSLSVSP